MHHWQWHRIIEIDTQQDTQLGYYTLKRITYTSAIVVGNAMRTNGMSGLVKHISVTHLVCREEPSTDLTCMGANHSIESVNITLKSIVSALRQHFGSYIWKNHWWVMNN